MVVPEASIVQAMYDGDAVLYSLGSFVVKSMEVNGVYVIHEI